MWDGLDNVWMDPELKYQHPSTVRDWRVSNINRRDEIHNFIFRGQIKYELLQELTESWAASIEFVEESDEVLAEAIRSGQTARVRYASPSRKTTSYNK